MKKILVLLGFCWCGALGLALELSAQTWEASAYSGYRCGLMAIREVKFTKEGIEFTADIANTGRLVLEFQAPKKVVPEIVFTADASLTASNLAEHRDLLAAAILRSGLRIKPGQMVSGKRFRSGPKDFGRNMQPKDTLELVPSKVRSLDDSIGLDACPDLVIDSIWIIRVRRYKIEFGWRISNQGLAPAFLWGRNGDGVGLGAYLGSGTRITRASKPLGLIPLRRKAKSMDGVLAPKASTTGEGTILLHHLRLPSERVLQVRLDPNGLLSECVEYNNESTIPLPEEDQ